MEIVFYKEKKSYIKNIAVAVGTFDGVHCGHKALLSEMVRYGKENNIKTAVLTFYNRKEPEMGLISHPKKREKLIEELGVDYLIYLDFEDFYKMPAEEYIEKFLYQELSIKAVFFSNGHRFGKMAKGDGDLLIKWGEKLGFESFCVPLLEIEGEKVCSSRIRELLKKGEIEKANKMLGYGFSYKLRVIKGNQLGRELGFPTINQVIDEEMLTVKKGVYATISHIEKTAYPSVTNIGTKPTVRGDGLYMETHIMNCEKDLYGKEIKVEFIKWLRDEKKFDTITQLKNAIKENKEKALEIYKTHG